MIITTPDDWFVAIKGRRYDAVSRSMRQFSGSRTSDGDTGLILSVQQNDPDMVRILAPTEAGLTNNNGSTALLVAAELGYLACCIPLLQYERSITNSQGCTPLMMAARAGSMGCIPFLITDSLLNRDDEGRNALDWAVAAGQVEAVRLLSQPELYPVDDVRYAIDLADSMGHLAISKILCRRIAGCQGADSISPPASIIISTVPNLPNAHKCIPCALEGPAQTIDPNTIEDDSSMCIDDLSTKDITVSSVPHTLSTPITDGDLDRVTQQLDVLTKTNAALQSNYRSMIALCDEARLKLAMQKDSIESSASLVEKLRIAQIDKPEAAEIEATRRVLHQKMLDTRSLQHEVIKITSEIYSLVDTISNSNLID